MNGCACTFLSLYVVFTDFLESLDLLKVSHFGGLGSPKFFGRAENMGAKNSDFRRATVFCLGYRLTKHKITRYSENLKGDGPLVPPNYAYISCVFERLQNKLFFLCFTVRSSIIKMRSFADM